MSIELKLRHDKTKKLSVVLIPPQPSTLRNFFMPVLIGLSKRVVSSYEVVEYNFDVAMPMRRKYKVDRVPTFIVVSEGEEIRRQVGFNSTEKLKDFLD